MPKVCDTISIRKTNGLIIVFYNQRTIYVKSKWGLMAYERWFMKKRMFYSHNFRPFSESLKQNRHISLEYINRLAELYDMKITRVGQLADFGNKKVKILPEHGRSRNKGCERDWQAQKAAIMQELGL